MHNREELFQQNLTIWQNLYAKYAYVFNGFQDFSDFICQYLVNNNVNEKVLYKDSEKYIIKYIKDNLANNKINILLNYITSNIDINNSPYKEVLKVVKWFNNINYIPTSNNIMELIENSEPFNYLLTKIVEKNLERIKKQEIQFDDELLQLFIDEYCTLNHIDYEESQEDLPFMVEDNTSNLAVSYGAKAIIDEIRKMNLEVLTAEEEKDLLLKIKNGDIDAYQKFYYHNLRLVVSVAKKFVNRGVPLEDLIQEGSISLMNAIKHFDIERGYKFSTYATWAIKRNLLVSIAQYGRTIRIPHGKSYELYKYDKNVLELEKELGHELSDEDIAHHLNMTLEEVQNNNNWLKDCLSLNQPIVKDEEDEIIDFISNNTNVENEFFAHELPKDMKILFQKAGLTSKEVSILKYRWGLDNAPELSLEQIGKYLGITRERVKQIEDKAIRKIRNCSFSENFIYYLDNPDKAMESIDKTYTAVHKDYNLGKIDKINNKRKNIYSINFIKNYSEEEINLAISKLDDLDKEILQLFYNVDAIRITTIANADINKYLNVLYERVIPNLKQNLENIKAKKLSRK